jgi:hypothetical protein
LIVDAATHEDELRLRAYLRGSKQIAALPRVIAQLLDDLDQVEAEAA